MKDLEMFFATFTLLRKYVKTALGSEVSKLGIKTLELVCLFLVEKGQGEMTASKICKLAGVDKAGVSRCIKSLTEKGFVVCENNREKRKYQAGIALTDDGKGLVQRISDRISYAKGKINAGIPDLERFACYATLHKIIENLKVFVNEEGEENG